MSPRGPGADSAARGVAREPAPQQTDRIPWGGERPSSSRTPLSCPTRWSPASSGGALCPARSSGRQTWTAVMPMRRGPADVGLPGVTDEEGVAGVDTERLGGLDVDAGVRLARPGPRRGDTGIDQVEQADLVEEVVELPSPVGADADGHARLAQRRERRLGLRIGHHPAPIRLPQGVDDALDVRAVHTAGIRQITQARPDPGLVGLLADRVLGVVDAVVAGEVLLEDGSVPTCSRERREPLRSWRHGRRPSGRGSRRNRR